MRFTQRHPGAAGFLPEMLSLDDPRPAKEQLAETYAHGGGFQHFEGFTLHAPEDKRSWLLQYPGDPPLQPKAYGQLRTETLVLFDYDWLVIRQANGEWEVARLD